MDADTAVLQAAEHIVEQHYLTMQLGMDKAIDAVIHAFAGHIADLEQRVYVLEQLLLT